MELQTLFRRERAAWSYSYNIVLYFSDRLMGNGRLIASPLFRIKDPILAGWKTGSNKIVGLKMAT